MKVAKGVTFAAVLLLLVAMPLTVALRPPRHVDPLQVREEVPDALSMLQYYGAILDLLRTEAFADALAKLKDMLWIHVPENVRFVVTRFTDLVRLAGEQLDQVRTQITNASQLVDQARLTEARFALGAATFALAQANRTVGELEQASEQIARSVGIPLAGLREKVGGLRDVIVDYRSRIAELYRRINAVTEGVESRRLQSTTLGLTAFPSMLEVGARVDVEGSLRASRNGPLGAREVRVYFEGSPVTSAKTGSDGSFSLALEVPFIYIPRAALYASYLPAGSDAATYAPSSSERVYLHLLYVRPQLELVAPAVAYPTIPFAVSGNFSAGEASPAGYAITVEAFGARVRTSTDRDGRFQVTLTPPHDVATGMTQILASVEAKGKVAPARDALQVRIVRIRPVLTATTPPIAIAGLPVQVTGLLVINGTVLRGAQVELLTPDARLTAESDSAGRFGFTLTPSASLASGGWNLVLRVYPREAWAEAIAEQRELFLFSPYTVLLPSAAAVVLVASLRRARGKREGVVLATAVGEQPMQVAPAPAVARADRHPQVTLYWLAVDVVAKLTGIAQQPHQTMREYLQLVEPALGTKYAVFEAITHAAEAVLYGLGVTSELERAAQAGLAVLEGALHEA